MLHYDASTNFSILAMRKNNIPEFKARIHNAHYTWLTCITTDVIDAQIWQRQLTYAQFYKNNDWTAAKRSKRKICRSKIATTTNIHSQFSTAPWRVVHSVASRPQCSTCWLRVAARNQHSLPPNYVTDTKMSVCHLHQFYDFHHLHVQIFTISASAQTISQ